MPEPTNNQGKILNALTSTTPCGLGAGCDAGMGLPREGQAVAALPSASTLPISEYHKLETLQALLYWLTADTKPGARSHSRAISRLRQRGESTQHPPPHSPSPMWDSATSGALQKGAARRGLPEAAQVPAGRGPQPAGRLLSLGPC